MQAIGRKQWIVGGHIPARSSGVEPDFTSHDRLSILNTGDRIANIRILLHYADAEPVGPYRIIVAPGRVRGFRLNDLIDPAAMPLDMPYSALIRSDVPVVIQLTHQDTRQRELTVSGTLAYAHARRSD